MVILFVFAFLAGIVTVLSPCVLPVLPALLAGGSGKGVYRPLGIVIGVIISFTFFTLALASIVQATGLSANVLRYFAMIVIAGFGIILIFPRLGEYFAQSTSSIGQLGSEIQQKGSSIQSGFFGGFVLGFALGLIWTPCAGPILAAIITLVATHAISLSTILLTLAYSIGAAIPMFLIAYGGNRALTSSRYLAKHSQGIRQFFGVLMLLTALAIATRWDIAFEQYAIKYVPPISIEDNQLVKEELHNFRKESNTQNIAPRGNNTQLSPTASPTAMMQAPELKGITHWLNSEPLTLAALKGKVVLIDFWTYSCINCVRTLPYLKGWYDKYKDKGFVIIGVHSPEFEFEKDTGNVEDAIKQFKIAYPVAQDNNFNTWRAYNNEYWPAHYLIDQKGIIQEVHFGEGGYMETENAIRALLHLQPLAEENKAIAHRPITPETYLGFSRGDRYTHELTMQFGQKANYNYSKELGPDQVGLKGPWNVDAQYITSEGDDAVLDLNFLATRVYLVLGGKSQQPITVLLDGKPLPKEFYTKDMNGNGQILVTEPRMYDIINLHGKYDRHLLTLKIPMGIQVYAFTFGDEE